VSRRHCTPPSPTKRSRSRAPSTSCSRRLKEFIREQVFIYTVIDKSFPWLRRGRPVGTTYEQFEKWHQENITQSDEERSARSRRAAGRSAETYRGEEMIRTHVLAALAALAAVSCASKPREEPMDTVIKSWFGEHIERVVDQWGMPDGEQKIMGRTLYVWGGTSGYATNTFRPPPAYGISNAYATTTPVGCTRRLEVSDTGTVVAGGYGGNSCCWTMTSLCKAWLNPRR
jgi:hypothetical protein